MMSRKLTTALAALTASVILMTSAALASPAQSTTSLNVRSGPSVGYRVVDVLYPGEHVDVETCRRNGWCYVSHRGRDGWVSSRYLRDVGYYKERRVVRSRRHAPQYYENTEEFQLRFGGPNFSFSFGSGRVPSHGHDCFRRHGHIICR